MFVLLPQQMLMGEKIYMEAFDFDQEFRWKRSGGPSGGAAGPSGISRDEKEVDDRVAEECGGGSVNMAEEYEAVRGGEEAAVFGEQVKGHEVVWQNGEVVTEPEAEAADTSSSESNKRRR